MVNLKIAFQSVEKEYSKFSLKGIENKLPKWFSGSVIRVGPAKFDYAGISMQHWFDGLAMLYKFDYSKDSVNFTNKFVVSEQYRSSLQSKMQYDEFATKAPLSKVRFLVRIIKKMLGIYIEKLSCNVNIINIAGRNLATSEVTSMMEFRHDDLSTIGEFTYSDNLKGQFSCAHPQIDPDIGEQYNFVVDISKKCKYTIYKLDKNSQKREALYEFEDQEFIYNHSLFLTKNYVVLYLGPTRAKPIDFLSKSVAETLYYDGNADCKFILLNRKTLGVSTITAPNFVFLHSINAFDQDDDICLDFVEYINELEPYKKFYFKSIIKEGCVLKTKVSRLSINLDNNEINKTTLLDKDVEFPRINETFLTKRYGYVYFASRDGELNFYN